MKTIGAKYKVPVIELQGIDKAAGHPTRSGMTAICKQINAFMATEKK